MLNIPGKMTNRAAGSECAGDSKQDDLLVRELLARVVLLGITTRRDRILLFCVWNPA